jgi:hypothetical protein
LIANTLSIAMPDHDETTLDIEATLEIDPRDVHIIDGGENSDG